MQIGKFVLYAITLWASLGASAATQPSLAVPAGLSVSHAWVRANAPGLQMAAAYFDLKNSRKTPATLLSISTPGAERASMHATVITRGVASMREIPELKLLAGETVMFEPGGMHVMLTGLQSALQAGKSLSLTLHFAGGETLQLLAPIQPIGAAAAPR